MDCSEWTKNEYFITKSCSVGGSPLYATILLDNKTAAAYLSMFTYIRMS